MRGVSFQNGVEFKVTIEGESWSPGDILKGRVESKPASGVQIILAEALDRKVKLKTADAFVVIEEKEETSAPFEWKFPLALDARVSDTVGSLYLLYGKGENIEKFGQLRLNIVPHILARDLVDLMTMHFRFALKKISSSKGGFTEIKIDPPDIKEWASLEQVLIFVRLDEETMEVKFQFHRNEIDPGKGGLATRAVKRDFNRRWETKSIIHDFNQRLNKDVVTAEVDKIISEYRNAGWLNS